MDAIATYYNRNTAQTLEIIPDSDPESPREGDNLGTIVCWHSRYNLGDKHDFADPSDFQEWTEQTPAIILPLYLYEHGGITIRSGIFSDDWNSGQVGYIYITLEDVRKEYGWKHVTAKRHKQIKTYLQGEVETYAQYLEGSVYGFILQDAWGQDVDSCFGFYGHDPKKNGIDQYVDMEGFDPA
jgi:hypothetical protein